MAVLTEEQTMLRDAAKDWVQAQAPVSALRKRRDAGLLGFDAALWAEMGQMGWAGVLVPEAHGGSGFGYLGLGLVLEETGRTLAASPLLSTALIGASALEIAGSAAQQAQWLPKIAAGEAVFALAVDEGPHHDPLKTALKAERSGDGYVLKGKKVFVLDGMEADVLIVAGRTSGRPGEAHGITLFLVPADAAGLTRTALHLIDSRGAASLAFDGVTVPADHVLGAPDGSFGPLEAVLDRARAGLAAEMLGTALQAFETTLDYLKTRNQFGQLIGGFQALQHRAAKMFTDLELTRSAVEAALTDLDRGANDVRAACSLAKAMAGETLHKVSNEMVQMHGGIGMTDQADMGLYLKRARVAEAAYGSAAYHRDRYATLMGF
jgi:alkylation response protein AidB-like acyl-CoA dehydrogenase